MRTALSTRLFANQRLTTALLDKVARAGVRAVQLHCDRRHLDYRQRAQIDELRHWFDDSETQLASVAAPLRNDQAGPRGGPDGLIRITVRDKPSRIQATDELKRALEMADRVSFRYFVVQIGVDEEEFEEAKLDAAFNALDELHVMARQLGVEILLANSANELSTAERLEYFLRVTHLPVRYSFDAGVAHRGAGVKSEFEKMQERIEAMSIHDNDGEKDLRLLPGSHGGTLDLAQTAALIAGLDAHPLVVVDAAETAGGSEPLEAAVEAIARLEEAGD